MTQDPFDTNEFREIHMEMCIDAWNDQFLGIDYLKPFEEIIYVHSNIEEIERYMSEYKEKYGTNLKYRLDKGCSYISQIK